MTERGVNTGTRASDINVSQWAHIDALLTLFLMYSYDINWVIASTLYPGRPGEADGLCDCRMRMRVRAHRLVDGFAGSLVGQYQLASLTHPCCGCIFSLSPSEKV